MTLDEFAMRLILLLLPILVLVGCDKRPYNETPVNVSNVKCSRIGHDYDCSFTARFPSGVGSLGRYRFKGFSIEDGDVLYLRRMTTNSNTISYHRFPNE